MKIYKEKPKKKKNKQSREVCCAATVNELMNTWLAKVVNDIHIFMYSQT